MVVRFSQNHITAFRVAMVDVKRCCKRTGRSTPTVRLQVLSLVSLIVTMNPLLTAHIAAINNDPNGLGKTLKVRQRSLC